MISTCRHLHRPDAVPHLHRVVRSLPYHLTVNFRTTYRSRSQEDHQHRAQRTQPFRLGTERMAYYDGSGVNAAYNRAARTGVIIPVNRCPAAASWTRPRAGVAGTAAMARASIGPAARCATSRAGPTPRLHRHRQRAGQRGLRAADSWCRVFPAGAHLRAERLRRARSI